MRSQKAELIGAIVPVPSCAVSENADCNGAHSKMTPTKILLRRAFSTPQAAPRIWLFTGLTNSIRNSVPGICARQARLFPRQKRVAARPAFFTIAARDHVG